MGKKHVVLLRAELWRQRVIYFLAGAIAVVCALITIPVGTSDLHEGEKPIVGALLLRAGDAKCRVAGGLVNIEVLGHNRVTFHCRNGLEYTDVLIEFRDG